MIKKIILACCAVLTVTAHAQTPLVQSITNKRYYGKLACPIGQEMEFATALNVTSQEPQLSQFGLRNRELVDYSSPLH